MRKSIFLLGLALSLGFMSVLKAEIQKSVESSGFFAGGELGFIISHYDFKQTVSFCQIPIQQVGALWQVF